MCTFNQFSLRGQNIAKPSRAWLTHALYALFYPRSRLCHASSATTTTPRPATRPQPDRCYPGATNPCNYSFCPSLHHLEKYIRPTFILFCSSSTTPTTLRPYHRHVSTASLTLSFNPPSLLCEIHKTPIYSLMYSNSTAATTLCHCHYYLYTDSSPLQYPSHPFTALRNT